MIYGRTGNDTIQGDRGGAEGAADSIYGEAGDDRMLFDFIEDLAPDLAGGDVTSDIHAFPRS